MYLFRSLVLFFRFSPIIFHPIEVFVSVVFKLQNNWQFISLKRNNFHSQSCIVIYCLVMSEAQVQSLNPEMGLRKYAFCCHLVFCNMLFIYINMPYRKYYLKQLIFQVIVIMGGMREANFFWNMYTCKRIHREWRHSFIHKLNFIELARSKFILRQAAVLARLLISCKASSFICV